MQEAPSTGPELLQRMTKVAPQLEVPLPAADERNCGAALQGEVQA